MNETPNNQNEDLAGPPPRDELDGLLREWHATNAGRAAAGRDRLLAALAEEDARSTTIAGRIEPKTETAAPRRSLTMIRRIIVNRYAPLAAAAAIAAVVLPFVLPSRSGFIKETRADDSNIVLAPEGGRLDAFDREGNLLGPCALKHTDVKAEISGRFTRVTLTQQYRNPNPDKIEAVYTFPLSDRSGVDRMTMTIGDRVIVGEVKERQQARRIYEQAKAADRVASLLEQERPNIFTQSVANIEPGATIDISISYVEMVDEHDGEFSFAFPTVVSPRYIPGQPAYRRERPQVMTALPAGVQPRRGVVLIGPASITVTDNGPGISRSDRGLDARLLNTALSAAVPVTQPPPNSDTDGAYFAIQAAYADGSRESGVYRRDGLGEIGGRWFYCPPPTPPSAPNDPSAPGENFAQPTTQVPDADRITPMPTRPNVRAGHDISISVTMDTGGPGITSLDSPQHQILRTDLARNTLDQPRRISIALASLAEIPNRDFVLKWKQTSETISSRLFTHTGETGNFFSVQLDPPASNNDVRAVPRELVFVLDTSGSMNGRPISLCQEVMRKAIDQMRPQDTFNIITFAGATRIMWDRPRPNSPQNRDEAQRFIASWQGRGGTEMMTAIEAALRQAPIAGATTALTPAQLADLPADGREVVVEADDAAFLNEGLTKDAITDRAELVVRDNLTIKCSPFQLPDRYLKRASQTVADDSVTLKLLLRGSWVTVGGERIFRVASAEISHDSAVRPLRIVMFLTDAEVGNDFAIIDAIKRNRATTRVFSFGIGSSVNRYLIEQMAIAGGGEPEFIYANTASEQQATDAIERFNRRTRTPILSDIQVTFNGVQPLDVLPDPTTVHDLWDNRPLTFMGRYAAAGSGTLTIRGQTSRGPWERTIPIEFPRQQTENSSLPTLWARAKIDALIGSDLLGVQHGQPNPAVRAKVISLGETFNVLSQYTSFVAVDKLRVTIDGRPRLVQVPIELPDQTNWNGYFGELPSLRGPDESPRSAGAVPASPVQLHLQPAIVDKLVAMNEQVSLLQEATRQDRAGEPRPTGTGTATSTGVPVPSEPAPVAARPAPAVAPTTGSISPRVPGGTPGGGGGAPPSPALSKAPPAHVSPDAKPTSPQDTPRSRKGVGEESKKTDLRSNAPSNDSLPAVTPPASAPSPIRRQVSPAQETQAQPAGTIDPAARRGGERGESVLRATYGRGTSGTPVWALSSSTADRGSEPGAYSDSSPSPAELSLFLQAYKDTSNTNSVASDRLQTAGVPGSAAAPSARSVMLLAAAQLAEAGRVDDAKALLCNSAATGGVTTPADASVADTRAAAAQLCGSLEPGVAAADRANAIQVAYKAANLELASQRRRVLIQNRLAPDVFMRTPTGAAAAKSADSSQASVASSSSSLYVTILLADTSDKTIAALKALGLRVEAVRPEASVVVASVPLDKLESLALLEVVRRVELVPADDAKPKPE